MKVPKKVNLTKIKKEDVTKPIEKKEIIVETKKEGTPTFVKKEVINEIVNINDIKNRDLYNALIETRSKIAERSRIPAHESYKIIPDKILVSIANETIEDKRDLEKILDKDLMRKHSSWILKDILYQNTMSNELPVKKDISKEESIDISR